MFAVGSSLLHTRYAVGRQLFTKAFVYFLKSNVTFVRQFLNLEYVGSAPPFLSYLIVEYIPGIWISLVNSLNLLLVDHLSRTA